MSPEDHRGRGPATPWLVAGAAALVALVALLTPTFAGAGGSGSTDEPAATPSSRAPTSSSPQLPTMARREPGDPTALGKPDAPVVMVAYSDFQCPYCGRFARETQPALVKKYVDSGVLRIEWRDFPYLGPESMRAAHAARAAAAQGRFWAFHDALYAHQSAPNSGNLTPGYLRSVAARLGLAVPRFTKDMNSDLTAKLVKHDFDEGLSLGISGTPAFLINGRPVMGALPLNQFERTIAQARRAAAHGETSDR